MFKKELKAAGRFASARGALRWVKGGDDDGKFTEARRVFARLYHPDNVKSSGLEKAVRQEIFKEYWGELERIQKGGKK